MIYLTLLFLLFSPPKKNSSESQCHYQEKNIPKHQQEPKNVHLRAQLVFPCFSPTKWNWNELIKHIFHDLYSTFEEGLGLPQVLFWVLKKVLKKVFSPESHDKSTKKALKKVLK